MSSTNEATPITHVQYTRPHGRRGGAARGLDGWPPRLSCIRPRRNGRLVWTVRSPAGTAQAQSQADPQVAQSRQ